MKRPIFTIILLFFFGIDAFAQSPVSTHEVKEKNYYVKSKGYSSNPESDPPNYAHQLDEVGIEEFKNLNWIDAGLNYRMRLEHRDDDYRRSDERDDNIVLSRTQAYFGIKNIIDPLRFAFELQDSRRSSSEFPRTTSDVNKLNLFQGYAELFFKNPVFLDRPVSLRAGRMAFEIMDRKLISRDEWGNTGTNFQGYRATIGKKENDWQIDSFAMQPMRQSMDEADERDANQWVYGGVLNWRKWSEFITIQPFYLKLAQRKSLTSTSRDIESPGLRIAGNLFKDVFDYDLIGVYQFGENDGKTHRANAYAAEFGYNYKHQWKPRASLIYAYASGDKHPSDSKSQRFERFYGFNRAWSNSNHIEWENIKIAKSRIEFQPSKKLRFDSSFSFYWLASGTDVWERANSLQDKTGSSGNYIGHDFDVRAHYAFTKHLRTTLGYAHFIPGTFTKNVSGRSNSSDFLYLEITASVF